MRPEEQPRPDILHRPLPLPTPIREFFADHVGHIRAKEQQIVATATEAKNTLVAHAEEAFTIARGSIDANYQIEVKVADDAYQQEIQKIDNNYNYVLPEREESQYRVLVLDEVNRATEGYQSVITELERKLQDRRAKLDAARQKRENKERKQEQGEQNENDKRNEKYLIEREKLLKDQDRKPWRPDSHQQNTQEHQNLHIRFYGRPNSDDSDARRFRQGTQVSGAEQRHQKKITQIEEALRNAQQALNDARRKAEDKEYPGLRNKAHTLVIQEAEHQKESEKTYAKLNRENKVRAATTRRDEQLAEPKMVRDEAVRAAEDELQKQVTFAKALRLQEVAAYTITIAGIVRRNSKQ